MESLWGSRVSPSTISELNKKRMFTLRIDEVVLCLGSIYATIGVKSLKMVAKILKAIRAYLPV